MDNIIRLMNENGQEIEFEFLDLIEHMGNEYVILLPVEEELDDKESGEVVILKLEETGNSNTEGYVSVDDEEVLNTIFGLFKDKFREEFSFVD